MSTSHLPPSWQTDELAEAWPDSDSSRGTLSRSSSSNQKSLQQTAQTTFNTKHEAGGSAKIRPEDVEAMYGSIKYLGSGRGRPGIGGLINLTGNGKDSGKVMGGMRIVSGDVSFESEHHKGHPAGKRSSGEPADIPSPPSSGSESGKQHRHSTHLGQSPASTLSSAPAGTFLIRPTETLLTSSSSPSDPHAHPPQSDAPAFLAKVRAAAAGGPAGGGLNGKAKAGGGMRGLGIFEPLAIERMFDPPTPPAAQPQQAESPTEGEEWHREKSDGSGSPRADYPQRATSSQTHLAPLDTRFPSNGSAATSTTLLGAGTAVSGSTNSSATARPYGTLSRGGVPALVVQWEKRPHPGMPKTGMTTSPENMEAPSFSSAEESCSLDTLASATPYNKRRLPTSDPSQSVSPNNIPLRRTSHGFVPRRPSRLSESMTPPSPGRSVGSASGRSSPVGTDGDGERSYQSEGDRSDIRVAGSMDGQERRSLSEDKGNQYGVRYFSGQRNSMDDVGFTFSPSPTATSNLNRRSSIPDAASPFQPTPPVRSADQAPPRALKLFQLKYDTYTRDHVSELVDKLSVGGTPVKKLAERSAARRGRGGSEARIRSSSPGRRRSGEEGSIGRRRMGDFGSGGKDRRSWLRSQQEDSPHSSPGSGSQSGSGSGSGSMPEESGFEGGESSEDGSLAERNPKRIRLSEPFEEEGQPQEQSDWGSPERQQDRFDTFHAPSATAQQIQPSQRLLPADIAASAVSMAAAASSFKLGHGQKGDRRSWGEKGESLLHKIKLRGLGGSPSVSSVSSVTESSVGTESGSRDQDTMRSVSDRDLSSVGNFVHQMDLPPTPPLRSTGMIAVPAVPQRAPAMLSVPAQQNAAAPRISLRQPSGTVNSAHSGGSAQTSGGGTSSGSGTITSHYMSNGRDIMDRIKQRNVSESSGTATGGEVAEKPINVVLADRKGKGREALNGGLPSPPVHVLITEPSFRPASVASSKITVTRSIETLASNAVEDVNQYISSASTVTNTVGTAISTSFVKHRGPPSPPPPGGARRITRLAPHQVPRLGAPQGKMVYDAKAMSWVKVSGAHARLRQASTAEGSSSSGSEDVFAGMESLREDTPGVIALENDAVIAEDNLHDEEQDEDRSEASCRSDLLSGEQHSDVEPSRSSGSMVVIPAESELPSLMTIEPSEAPLIKHSLETEKIPKPIGIETARPLFKTVHSAPTPLENLGTPRSALKVAGAPGSAIKKTVNIGSVTPGRAEVNSPNSTLQRSVSFSDGRKDGRIKDSSRAEGKARKRSSISASSVAREDVFSQTSAGSGLVDQSDGASARTKRISKMLEGMDGEAPTPSRPPTASRHIRKISQSYDLTEENLTADTTIEGLSGIFARMRPSGMSARSLADATFLTECSFAVAHDKLVEIITEVRPFEPHWEELTKIDLSKRGATSVARLKEFLPKLDEANLNDNEISYLSGVPSTVRTLLVAGNKLSSVTAINHLLHLQYLDISRNDVDSVNPLNCLKHLRELKMDHNKVRDLSDIMSIDSLVKLSAVDNALESLDTTRAKWARLETLDVSHNCISEVRGIEHLVSAHTLNLDNNRLKDFAVKAELPTLRILRISHNRIPRLDVSDFPRLRTLYADGNRLSGLLRSKCDRMSKIEHLSLRNQSGQELRLTYADLRDVKRLYVSGNPLGSDFFPDHPLYSLIYLEAAACRLSAWPSGFATLIPNLRALNVNYNFMDSLKGLYGLQSLRKLSAVGAQLGLSDREEIMRSIRDLQSLEEVDLRMNPCTLGFYLPLVLPRGTEASALDPSLANPNTPESLWVHMDNTFRRSMPDLWYAKRLLYRGLLMEVCPVMRRVDGIEVTAGERAKARSIAELVV